MSSFKEPTTSRPLSHHRVSSSSTPLNVPGRGGHSGHRQHAHSVSLGAMNNGNRVSRRKSMSSNHLGLAVQHIDDASLEALVSPESGIARRAEHSRPLSSNVQPPVPQQQQQEEPRVKAEPATGDASRPASSSTKPRNRRASEGATLAKADGKRISGELKCDKCGKGYKHSSCLTKHLWEHTPEWAFTSKLLISKHQQVQLLEAASVLVNMNLDAPGDMSKAIESDNSSASPEASGSSELPDDELSSVETTPPPMGDHHGDIRDPKRHSSASSAYSRSYQSVPGGGTLTSSGLSSPYGSHHAGYGMPLPTSTSAYSGPPVEDEAGLAAAVKLVNFGTPRSNAQQMDDIPPVPPLPARYATHSTQQSMSGLDYTFRKDFSQQISDERDFKGPTALVSSTEIELDDRRPMSHGLSDPHDDGFFGRMEE